MAICWKCEKENTDEDLLFGTDGKNVCRTCFVAYTLEKTLKIPFLKGILRAAEKINAPMLRNPEALAIQAWFQAKEKNKKEVLEWQKDAANIQSKKNQGICTSSEKMDTL
jgi:hypothetical protein